MGLWGNIRRYLHTSHKNPYWVCQQYIQWTARWEKCKAYYSHPPLTLFIHNIIALILYVIMTKSHWLEETLPSYSSHNKPRKHANVTISMTFGFTRGCNGLCPVLENLIEVVINALAACERGIQYCTNNSKAKQKLLKIDLISTWLMLVWFNLC